MTALGKLQAGDDHAAVRPATRDDGSGHALHDRLSGCGVSRERSTVKVDGLHATASVPKCSRDGAPACCVDKRAMNQEDISHGQECTPRPLRRSTTTRALSIHYVT